MIPYRHDSLFIAALYSLAVIALCRTISSPMRRSRIRWSAGFGFQFANPLPNLLWGGNMLSYLGTSLLE